MPKRQSPLNAKLPDVWLVSDARNDAVLEAQLRRLPRGSGFIYRHYHLAEGERRTRFQRLAAIARMRGHRVIWAGTDRQARALRADGNYGACAQATAQGIALITAHSLAEIAAARRARADAIVLSPVFPTRSHPRARPLGPLRFRLLAARASIPVIALGGMDARRARRLGGVRWAAIDGIASQGFLTRSHPRAH